MSLTMDQIVSDPDEKLVGRFIAKGHHLHLLKVNDRYRVDYWDLANVLNSITQTTYDELKPAVRDFAAQTDRLLLILEE
ncbi:MAG: hypothetical protein EOO77_17915 [Oxalobacteraceae bacterium]|nr:MAG: hypothetical protein EOO77_17915 [Oxalobacteraceae bacterium]